VTTEKPEGQQMSDAEMAHRLCVLTNEISPEEDQPWEDWDVEIQRDWLDHLAKVKTLIVPAAKLEGRREAYQSFLREAYLRDWNVSERARQWIEQQRDACVPGAKSEAKPAEQMIAPAMQAVERKAADEVRRHTEAMSERPAHALAVEPLSRDEREFAVGRWLGRHPGALQSDEWWALNNLAIDVIDAQRKKVKPVQLAVEPLSEFDLREMVNMTSGTDMDLARMVAAAQRAKMKPATLPTVDELAKVMDVEFPGDDSPDDPGCATRLSLPTRVALARAVLAHLGAQPAEDLFAKAEQAKDEWAKDDLTNARRELERLQAEVERLKVEIKFLQDDVADATVANADLRQQVERLTSERDEWKRRSDRDQTAIFELAQAVNEIGGPSLPDETVTKKAARILREKRAKLDEQAAEIARLRDKLERTTNLMIAESSDEPAPQSPPAGPYAVKPSYGWPKIEPPAEAPMPRLEEAVNQRALEPCGLHFDRILSAGHADLAEARKHDAWAIEQLKKRIDELEESNRWLQNAREHVIKEVARAEDEVRSLRRGLPIKTVAAVDELNANAKRIAELSDQLAAVTLERATCVPTEEWRTMQAERDEWRRKAEENAQSARELAELRKIAITDLGMNCPAPISCGKCGRLQTLLHIDQPADPNAGHEQDAVTYSCKPGKDGAK